MISAYFFYRLTDLISIHFKENKIFMLTFTLHKMLKILIEILVQVFHDNNFFRLFFYFVLIGFGLYYIGFMAILRLSTSEKNLCVRV